MKAYLGYQTWEATHRRAGTMPTMVGYDNDIASYYNSPRDRDPQGSTIAVASHPTHRAPCFTPPPGVAWWWTRLNAMAAAS
jgi:hypothetical protein